MATARQQRGRRTNVVVAQWLAEHGWPDVEPTFGSEPGVDAKNIDGHKVEVKARADWRPLAWLRQARSHPGSGRPCVILRSNGQGEESVSDYLVIRRLEDDELNRLR